MGKEPGIPDPASWRVIVITNLAGGLVYSLANDVLRSMGHRVVGVLTSPGPSRRRSSSYQEVVAAVSPDVDILVSNHPARWAAMLAPLKPDLIICGGMPWRIPADLLALPRLGAINLHPALLPRHRGPAAIEWAFRSGDPELGMTIHRMSSDFDTGPILAQARVPIEDDDDFDAVISRLVPMMPDLLIRALERVAAGDPGEPQDEISASYAGLLTDDWRIIDWSRPAREIHNQVRSWIGMRDSPKGAFGEVEGERLLIIRTRLLPSIPGRRGEPGSVVHRGDETIVMQCGDGQLELIDWSRLAPTLESDVSAETPVTTGADVTT